MKLLFFLSIIPFIVMADSHQDETRYEYGLAQPYRLRSVEIVQIMELQEHESKVEFIFVCNKSSKEKGEFPMERKKHTLRLFGPLINKVWYDSDETIAFHKALVGTRVQVVHLKSGELLVDHEITQKRLMGTTGGIPFYTIDSSEYFKKGQAYKVTIQLPPKGDAEAIYQKLEFVIGIHRGVYL